MSNNNVSELKKPEPFVDDPIILQQELNLWQKRDLSDKKYVYFRAAAATLRGMLAPIQKTFAARMPLNGCQKKIIDFNFKSEILIKTEHLSSVQH